VRTTPIDVAVVGGGPAGLRAATVCAEAGLDVVVFEEHPTVGEPVHCTGIVSLETAELAKVPEDVVLGRLSRARLHGPGGETYEVGWDEPEREQILAIDRAAFDRGLAEQARAAGAVLQAGVRVSGVVPRADGVDVMAGDRTIKARASVLACGVAYRFHRPLGLGVPGEIVHGAQVEVDAAPADHVDIYFGRQVAPDGFAWAVPLSRDGRSRAKLGIAARGNAAGALQTFLARDAVRDRLAAEPGPPVRRLLPLKRIARTVADRVLVVGDAGGFTKPITGGGIFYSLLTAGLAAETLVEAFQRGRFDAAFLSRYERRWQDRLGVELRVAGAMRALAVRLSDARLSALLRTVTRRDVQRLILRTARFNWHAEMILALLRQGELTRVFFRSLGR
jgi:digeranylgeranylglycerophospholipid reductase